MRGQAHTLEATVAALLMLASLIFALQMTAVTPLSASTSSQHIENQQQAAGQGVLAAAASADALKPAILYWNNSSEQFYNETSGIDAVYTTPPPIRFGDMLNRSFNDRGIAYNVYFRFIDADGDSNRATYITSGEPSDNAVRATHTVTLTDDDRLYDANGTRNSIRLGDENTTYYRGRIPNRAGNIYNTVQVEVVAWRI